MRIGWCEFFLRAVIKSKQGLSILRLYENGFYSAKDIPAATAKRILVLLRASGMLKIVWEAKGRRPAVYAFLELIDVTEGRVSR